jgi:Ca2+-dependent lipid-binding protein
VKLKPKGAASWLCTSKIQKKTLTPKWNDTHKIKLIREAAKDLEIVVELWDADLVIDDYIGTGIIKIDSDTVGMVEIDEEVEMKGKKGDLEGTLKLRIAGHTVADGRSI